MSNSPFFLIVRTFYLTYVSIWLNVRKKVSTFIRSVELFKLCQVNNNEEQEKKKINMF